MLTPPPRPDIEGHPVSAAPTHAHRSFRVMGSPANVTLTSESPNWAGVGADALLDLAEGRLRELERHWSRFLPDSDITRANRAAGSPVTVHTDTLDVVARAIEAWKQTGGRFDATVLPALLHFGYTASQAPGSPASATQPTLAPLITAQRIGVTGSIVVDRLRSTLTVPAGGALDLGGIGKGYAADRVSTELIRAGASGAMVDIGGDLAVRGVPSSGERWLVGVEDPTNPPHLITSVALVIGGVATSGTTVRRWVSPAGETVHHLIDPATAKPSTTSVLTATVLAADASTAEAFATAAMMYDAAGALEMLDSVGLAGLLVTRDGTTLRTRSLRAFAP